MAGTYISSRSLQFQYFDAQLGHPDWTGKRVLDFGGNAGNILLDEKNRIDPANYWSIDISRDAIAVGASRHPQAHFHLYDGYNYEFNRTGTVGLPIPDLGIRYDVILAFSVFTHTSKAEMLELVDQLSGMLSENGTLAFTFLDPTWVGERNNVGTPDTMVPLPPGASNLHWGLRRRADVNPEIDVDALLAQAAAQPRQTWTTLVDNRDLIFDPDYDSAVAGDEVERARHIYLTFCTADYMQRLYPQAQILPPAPREWQHCAILRRSV